MITLAAADTLAGGASVASQVTSTVFGMELAAAGTEVYKVLDQRQLASTPATIYTTPGSTTTFIKTITVVNNDTSARSAQYFRAGTSAATAITPALLIPAGGMAVYEDGKGWTVHDSSGAAATQVSTGSVTMAVSGADVSNSTTSMVAVGSGIDLALGVGTFSYDYMIRYQGAATTTGIKFAIDHTGTVTAHIYNMMYVDVSATAATAAASQAANAATGQVLGAFSSRADNTTLGPTISVDSAGGEMLMKIEGIVIVTAAGLLRLMHGSEVAAATTVKAGSHVIATKVA